MAVLFPFSYTFSREMQIVPTSVITLLNLSTREVMNFIISGGVAEVNPGVKEKTNN